MLYSGRTGIMSSLAVFVVLLTLCSGTPAMKFKGTYNYFMLCTLLGYESYYIVFLAIFNITCHQEGLSKVDMNFILESILSVSLIIVFFII